MDLYIVLENHLDKAKIKKKKKKIKETGDTRYIYQNQLDKVCFQHDMAYGDFKDLTRRIAFDKILHDKAFNINILKIQKMMDINGDLLQWFINFLIKEFLVVPLRLQISLLLKMKIFQTRN